MSLGQVRSKINEIDDNMKQLFDARMECSNQVADIKIKENDKVFKPLREKEIVQRFAGDEEYLAFVKKVMQISRRRQYGIFFDTVDAVSNELMEEKKDILEKGFLELKLMADRSQENGLNANDILSIIADTSLYIRSLNVCEDGCVSGLIEVPSNDKAIKEALILKYMLSEETIEN